MQKYDPGVTFDVEADVGGGGIIAAGGVEGKGDINSSSGFSGHGSGGLLAGGIALGDGAKLGVKYSTNLEAHACTLECLAQGMKHATGC
jgi:hypothetical protein